MGKTSIEWTDASWNPIVGCTEVSPGCANCYAARLAATRLKNVPSYKGLSVLRHGKRQDIPFLADGSFAIRPRWTGEVRFLPERLEEPLHWRKPRRIFVCDMGDLFHESIDFSWIGDIWRQMAKCPQHTFQVLTKRPARMLEFLSQAENYRKTGVTPDALFDHWPLPNVWLGVSVENQHFADERIPLLLQTPAAVRFISAEPLLGSINLNCVKDGKNYNDTVGGIRSIRPNLDWVIAGGESGPNARPMHPDWARGLRDQCQAAGVPFFFKQWGQWVPWDPSGKLSTKTALKGFCGTAPKFEEQWMVGVGKKKSGRLLDGREWSEFPK